MLNSYYKPLAPVTLPWANRQMYMHTFDIENPEMPMGFEDYEQVIKNLCSSAGISKGTAHFTVDERIVQAGTSQRKPKPHVDGCYLPTKVAWGHDNGGGWNHSCNIIPARMSVIVAASVSGCRAWEGQFDTQPKNNGDLSHLELDDGYILPPNQGFLLSPDCVHESMVFKQDTKRTFLRIALPVEFTWASI